MYKNSHFENVASKYNVSVDSMIESIHALEDHDSLFRLYCRINKKQVNMLADLRNNPKQWNFTRKWVVRSLGQDINPYPYLTHFVPDDDTYHLLSSIFNLHLIEGATGFLIMNREEINGYALNSRYPQLSLFVTTSPVPECAVYDHYHIDSLMNENCLLQWLRFFADKTAYANELFENSYIPSDKWFYAPPIMSYFRDIFKVVRQTRMAHYPNGGNLDYCYIVNELGEHVLSNNALPNYTDTWHSDYMNRL